LGLRSLQELPPLDGDPPALDALGQRVIALATPLAVSVPVASELPAPELPAPELPAPELPAPELPDPPIRPLFRPASASASEDAPEP
jgi:hypothetical protein